MSTAPPVDAASSSPAERYDAPRPRWWRRWFAWASQLVSGYDVFISYSRSDAFTYAQQLQAKLARRRLSTFLDEARLEAGSLLPRRIRSAARRSSVMVLLTTPGAVQKADWISTEIGHARDSLLQPAIVPVVFPPLRPGRLPEPLDQINDRRMLEDSEAALGTGPASRIVDEIIRALSRRRLIWKRAIAVLALAAMVAAVVVWLRQDQVASRRALAVQRWTAAAAQAASRGRHDVAEYALARAVEEDPSAIAALLAPYREHRAARVLRWAGQRNLDPDARVAGIVSSAVGADAVVTDGHVVELRGARVACESMSHVVECEPEEAVLACANELIAVGRRGDVVRRVPIGGDLHDVACVGSELRVLVERDRILRVLHLEPDATEASAPELLSGAHAWMDAGLCHLGVSSAFRAHVEMDALIIERGGPGVQGGPGAVGSRVERSGLVMATITADPSCERFFIAYSRSDPAALIRTLPTQWAMLEWSTQYERDLPSTIRAIVPLPQSSGYYAAYLTTDRELALLPVTDMVVNEISPSVIATDARALAPWDTSTDAKHARIASLDGGLLAIRDNGEVVSRYAVHVAEPTRIYTSERRDALVVEGRRAAEIWRRSDDAVPHGIPPAITVAADLGLLPSEIHSIEVSSTGG